MHLIAIATFLFIANREQFVCLFFWKQDTDLWEVQTHFS